MAGLIPAGPQQGTQAPAQPAQAQPGSDPNVNRIAIAAKKALAEPQIAQQIVQVMKASGDPATGIAKAMIFLMRGLVEKSQGTMPKQAIPMAAATVLLDVARVGEAAGLFQLTPQLLIDAGKKTLELQGGKQAQAPAQPAAAPPMQPPAQPPVQQQPLQAGA